MQPLTEVSFCPHSLDFGQVATVWGNFFGGNMKKIDLTGHKFGRLTAIKFVKFSNNKTTYWLCECDCGNKKLIQYESLVTKKTVSCGCFRKEINKTKFTTHGKSKSKIYKIWQSMKERCGNKNNKDYGNYGDRGIKICKRWGNFINFYSDMGNKPHNFTIERIDNNKGYSPENCRWASWLEQQNNRRDNRRVSFDNKMLTISQWSRKLKVHPQTLYSRINNNRGLLNATYK